MASKHMRKCFFLTLSILRCLESLSDVCSSLDGQIDGWILEPVMSSLVHVVCAARGAPLGALLGLLALRYGRQKKK